LDFGAYNFAKSESFKAMSERATTQIFGWALSGVLFTMLVLNAIAG